LEPRKAGEDGRTRDKIIKKGITSEKETPQDIETERSQTKQNGGGKRIGGRNARPEGKGKL